jgi:hypothetical protein
VPGRRLFEHTPNWFAIFVVWLLAWALIELAVTGWGRWTLPRAAHIALGVVLFPLVGVLLHRAEWGRARR